MEIARARPIVKMEFRIKDFWVHVEGAKHETYQKFGGCAIMRHLAANICIRFCRVELVVWHSMLDRLDILKMFPTKQSPTWHAASKRFEEPSSVSMNRQARNSAYLLMDLAVGQMSGVFEHCMRIMYIQLDHHLFDSTLGNNHSWAGDASHEPRLPVQWQQAPHTRCWSITIISLWWQHDTSCACGRSALQTRTSPGRASNHKSSIIAFAFALLPRRNCTVSWDTREHLF